MNKLNLIGQKFNKWTVLKKCSFKQKGARDVLWECLCECGKTGIVKSYYLTKGYSKGCIDCGHNSKLYEIGIPDSVWNRILRNAKKRDIKVLVSKQEAYDLYIAQCKKCALSGEEIRFPINGSEQREGEGTASLDRIDSKLDYQDGNIQWVHKNINRMKNIFGQDYFISICQKICNHQANLK